MRFMKIAMFGLLSLACSLTFVGCQSGPVPTSGNEPPKMTQAETAQNAQDVAYSLTITGLNALAMFSKDDSADWAEKVDIIRSSVAEPLTLAAYGSISGPAAINLIESKLPGKYWWTSFADGLGATFKSYGTPGLIGMSKAVNEWLAGNP